MTTNRTDIPSPSAPNFEQRVRETLMTYLGKQGNVLDRGLTLRDLVENGLFELGAGWRPGGPVLPLVPGPNIGSDEIDLTPPPTPTGFAVTAALSHIFIEHDEPTFLQGRGYKQTRVYGVTVQPGDPLPTFDQAIEITQFSAVIHAHPSNPATTWRLWIKWETNDGVLSASPAGGTNGLEAITGQDVNLLLETLTGQITESQLFNSLGSRINLIDAPDTTPNSVAARIQAEATARAQAILNEASARNAAIGTETQARVAGLAAEATTRQQAIITEATARANAISAEAQTRADSLSEEAAARQAAIVTEATTRQSADESLASSITTLTASLTSNVGTLTSAIENESSARVAGDVAEANSRQSLAAQLRGSYSGSDIASVTTGLLYSERTARVTEDTALSNRIDTIVAASSGDFQDLFAAITAEETARISGDTANASSTSTLQTRLDNLRDKDGVQTNKSIEAAIVDNKTAQVSGDAALSSTLTALSTTVTNNYSTLNSAITSEASTRTTAISAEAAARSSLSSQIRGNYAGTDINSVTSGLIYSERLSRVNADSSLQSQINLLSASSSGNFQEALSAIQEEQAARAAGDEAEASARQTLAAQIRGTYTGTDLNQVTTGLVYSERVARVTADASISSSVSALSSTVSNNLTTLNSAITSEATTRANADTTLTTNLNALSSTVTTNNNAVNAAITSEATTRANADSALSNTVNSLSSTVTGNFSTLTAAIASEATTRANADSALSTQINTVSAQATKTRTYSQATEPSTGMIAGDLWFDTDANNKPYRYSGSTWVATDDTRIGINTAAIQTEATARANADSSLASQITTVQAVANLKNRIYRQTSAPTGTLVAGDLWFDTDDNNKPYRWTGTAWESVEDPRISANAVSIQTEATARANADNSLFAQYTVKIDTSGYVSGFGLASTANNSVPFSEFAVRADRFYIANPTGPSIAPAIPFIVQTTATTINGVSVPVGVYITDAFIRNGTITNAKIGNAAIDTAKIADAAISTAKIGDAQISDAKIQNATITGAKIASATITTANIAAAAIGTAQIADATITNAKIATLDATKITSGFISADRIEAGTLDAKVANIDAAKITSGTINSARIGQISLVGTNNFNVKTGTSGARMEMSNRAIKVFDANGVLRVQLGDLSV